MGDLMVVILNFSFNLIGIWRSYNTLEALLHFSRPANILLTSSSISPYGHTILGQENGFLWCSFALDIIGLLSSFLVLPNLHCVRSILDLFILNPFDFNPSLRASNLALASLVSSIKRYRQQIACTMGSNPKHVLSVHPWLRRICKHLTLIPGVNLPFWKCTSILLLFSSMMWKASEALALALG